MPVTVTVGTNSYISVADAELYLHDRLFADAWNNSSEDDKARSLIMASKKIDRLLLKGTKKESSQAMQFPRCYLYDNRFFYPEDVQFTYYNGWHCEIAVPQAVKDAVCEEALELLSTGNDTRVAMQMAGVKSYSLGSLSETFTDSAIDPKNSTGRGLLSDEAKALMKLYIAGAVRTL